MSPQDAGQIISALAPSLVQVEWTAQYDKGESPGGDRWGAWRAFQGGGGDESDTDSWADWDQFITQERPKTVGGFLIDDKRVFTLDPEVHPRFVKSIQVRFGNTAVDAIPVAYGATSSGMILELQGPLSGVKPLTFNPTLSGPFYQVSHRLAEGVWTTTVSPVSTSVSSAGTRLYSPGRENVLIIDKAGTPVALGTGEFPGDGSWKRAAKDWPTLSSADLDAAMKRVDAAAGAGVLRTTVHFRSPRADDAGGGGRFSRYMPGGDHSEITEWNGIALATDPQNVLVLASFPAKTTGRLERIVLHLPDGKTQTAKFAGSLKDWGAFWATPESPLPAACAVSSEELLALRDKLLVKTEVTVRGDTRTAYMWPSRFDSYYTAYKGRVFPGASAAPEAGYNWRGGGGQSEAGYFYFLPDSTLVGFPLERRDRVAQQDRYSWGSQQSIVATASLLKELAADRAKFIDAENRPLTEEEENRLAWLGVEMQPLDPELARANNMMDETNGGESGGMVTHVYPNSPATEHDIQVGDVILRLEIEGQPKPVEVALEDGFDDGMMDQFWQYLDQVPAEYFDQMPKPWGSAENTVTRTLTEVGFGTKFVADVWRDGTITKKAMVVTEGPKHWASAARYKSPESIGITVRDLTYEVRRYFQMSPEEPGVIIAKVEPGSRAAVAGIKPFEIIHTADDKPIASVKDFEARVKAGGEARLGVKRMTKGRTVKLKLDAAAPDEEPDAATDAMEPDDFDVDEAPEPAGMR